MNGEMRQFGNEIMTQTPNDGVFTQPSALPFRAFSNRVVIDGMATLFFLIACQPASPAQFIIHNPAFTF